MAESYTHNGVTITDNGGGHFTLTHPTLPAEGEKVRGREVAESRADEIAQAAPMEPQAPIPPADAGGPTTAPIDKQDENTAERQASAQQTSAAAEKPSPEAVPEPQERPADQPAQIPNSAPREYTGTLTPSEQRKVGLKMVRIVLEENENIPPTGLYVGHNGRGYLIMPNAEVDVPWFLLKVLDDAKMSTPVKDPQTQKVLGYRDRSRYPYRLV